MLKSHLETLVAAVPSSTTNVGDTQRSINDVAAEDVNIRIVTVIMIRPVLTS